jgi:hypothetical protein
MDSSKVKRLKYYYRFFSEQAKYLDSVQGTDQVQVRSISPILTELTRLNKEFPDVAIDNYTISPNQLDKYIDLMVVRSCLSRAISQLDVEINSQIVISSMQKREFAFIKNTELRNIIERDYEEICKANTSGCWKSVIILCGGSIEAILTDLLLDNQAIAVASKLAPKENDITKWDFARLIEVAVELNLVSAGIQKLSHTLREYRNLVHPSYEIRNKLVFSAEEAKIAVEVLHILHRELVQ